MRCMDKQGGEMLCEQAGQLPNQRLLLRVAGRGAGHSPNSSCPLSPEMGPAWPPAQRQDLRFLLFKTYRILCRVDRDRVIVSSVRHTRRDTDSSTE